MGQVKRSDCVAAAKPANPNAATLASGNLAPMTWLTDTVSQALPVFVQGLALSLGLIVAIGAQNAFVLRQGLRREHVGSVVLTS